MAFQCYENLVGNLGEIDMIAEAANEAIGQATSAGRTQGNAMTRAALVLLCGYLEGFVRDVAEEYIEILNELVTTSDAYPAPMFCALAKEMTENLNPEKGDTILSFREVFKAGKPAELNKKRFSKTGGNPTVDTIEAIFGILGIPDVIDLLSIKHYSVDSTFISESQVTPHFRGELHHALSERGKLADGALEVIVNVIEKKWSPRLKRRKVGYVNEIEQLLKKRNRIAHGEGSEQITPTELIDFKKCVMKLASGLHDELQLLLDKIRAKMPGGALVGEGSNPVAGLLLMPSPP
ncbi:MAE_28990/MAE_18760 family HEPN-like nuclease [Burkholderia ubonensis]|uniref:MAE_28990/MAE_18760 family HEPN-like nuclease n=1 Tax=Burkholderia ubonensis TaxID=101571 RepID=UPI000B164192|nr:MAE_28990/MAE_18760 family HEPN-like nuclease [Burkholderia ubonensis]